MSKLTTEIDAITMLKLNKAARTLGITPSAAVREIVTHGPRFFWAKVVGATKAK